MAVIAVTSIFLSAKTYHAPKTHSAIVNSVANHTTQLPSPTGRGAMSPRLSVINNQLFMIWLEPNNPDDQSSPALWSIKTAHWRQSDNTWSQPLVIHSSRQLFINWADAPSITATSSGRLYVHWLEKNKTNAPYAYDIQLAYSDDDGQHWQAMGTASSGQTPHQDSYDGFLSFLPAGDSTRAFWISARTPLGKDGVEENRKKMTLQTSLIDRTVVQSHRLDGDICSCCNTAAIEAAGGPIIFYRNHTPSDIRDIYFVRHVDGAWTQPAAVHDDNWEINGCPVNGPKAATNGQLIAIAWFTAAAGKNQIKLAWSTDQGQ